MRGERLAWLDREGRLPDEEAHMQNASQHVTSSVSRQSKAWTCRRRGAAGAAGPGGAAERRGGALVHRLRHRRARLVARAGRRLPGACPSCVPSVNPMPFILLLTHTSPFRSSLGDGDETCICVMSSLCSASGNFTTPARLQTGHEAGAGAAFGTFARQSHQTQSVIQTSLQAEEPAGVLSASHSDFTPYVPCLHRT